MMVMMVVVIPVVMMMMPIMMVVVPVVMMVVVMVVVHFFNLPTDRHLWPRLIDSLQQLRRVRDWLKKLRIGLWIHDSMSRRVFRRSRQRKGGDRPS